MLLSNPMRLCFKALNESQEHELMPHPMWYKTTGGCGLSENKMLYTSSLDLTRQISVEGLLSEPSHHPETNFLVEPMCAIMNAVSFWTR